MLSILCVCVNRGARNLTGDNAGIVFTLYEGVLVYAYKIHLLQKQLNLKLKALPKQLLGLPPVSFHSPHLNVT